MSIFTDAEIEYMRENTMCRMATIGRNGEPHIAPVTYVYNAAEDAIDIGGIDFANTKKWRDVQHNRNLTILVDDFSPTAAHAVEVRGEAELHQTGGSQINPRIQGFVEQFVRLRPHYIVSWGIEAGTGLTPEGFKVTSRRVE
jgi:pyridoxamine 5'-phosphate oxidase family protein